MNDKKITTHHVEYIEYAVNDLKTMSSMLERMAFTCIGERKDGGRQSKLYMQGDIRIVVSASSHASDPVHAFAKKHGDGVITMGLLVDDAKEAHELATHKGAKSAMKPGIMHGGTNSTMHRSAIHMYGDVEHVFLNFDKGSKFEHFFPEHAVAVSSIKGKLLQTIDHITVNLEKGQVDRWANFYTDLFGFSEVRYFDIQTAKSGLFSRAMRSPNGRVTMPFNEPTNEKSQIQEFVNTFKGPGIQHLALHTPNIVQCLNYLMEQNFKFLTVPATYYEEVPKRVPHITEDMNELQRLGVLIDGSDKGYLLQIFSEPCVGPFFFEYIQRKGDKGFGEGNFRALFEAIERDQERRGVL